MIKSYIWYLLAAIGLCVACSDVDPFQIDNVDFGDPEIGLPLVNSTFLISDFGTNPNDNTSIILDDQGRLTVRYNGQVLRQDKNFVFPPLPFLDWIQIVEPVMPFALPLPDVIIRKAIFEGTAVKFRFDNSVSEDVTVNLTIPEFTRDGEIFSHDVVVGPNTIYESDLISIDGYTIETETSTFTFVYTATTASGQSIVLNSAEMFVDILSFSYGEGNFGVREFNLSEDMVDIGIFKQWVSGGLSFDRPSVTFDIKNSFGFPVRADFKKLELVTINGDVFQLTGPAIQDGIDFQYPGLSEVGEIKETMFTFTKDNSNLGELFNEKAANVTYNVDAIANPDNDTSITGHFTNESFFTVNVAVDLPMSLKANDLIMADTIAFEQIEFDQVDSTGQLKLKVVNAFPMDLSLNMDFLGADDNTLFSLISDSDWLTVNASPDPLLTLEMLDDQVHDIILSEEQISQIPSIEKVIVKAKVTTLDTFGEDFVWLYNHHGIDVNLGVILH